MSALLLTADLACSSKVSAAGTRVGEHVDVAMNASRLLERAIELLPQRIVLDLNAPGLDCRELVPKLKAISPPPQVIAFGPHVHEARLAAAQEAGCDRVFSRGQFYAQLDTLLRFGPAS